MMSKLWKKLPWVIAGILIVIVLWTPAFLPWALLVAVIGACLFMPRRGLIGPVELPANDAFLPTQQVQWWYWTGHLQTEDGRRFGFEVVFFTFDTFLFMRDQLVQAAITDVEGNRFKYKEFVKFHLPKRIKNAFNLSSDADNTITAVGGNGHDRLHAQVDDYVLDIELQATKPPVLHYDGSAHPYRFGGKAYVELNGYCRCPHLSGV